MSDNTPEEFKRLTSEVSTLRFELEKVNDDKEFWFKKKESLKTEINSSVNTIRNIKSESDKKNIELIELTSYGGRREIFSPTFFKSRAIIMCKKMLREFISF